LADSGNELSGSEMMPRQRLCKSALSLSAVTQFAIVLQVEVALPDVSPGLKV
jgi:hypothetical protein